MSAIHTGQLELGLTTQALWIGYFGLGGNGSQADVLSWLSGAAALPTHDHDLLAQAMNDEFTGRGQDHPVPYSDAYPS